MTKTIPTIASIVSRFEVLSHGFNGSQYFPGCGTAFTPFEHVYTGTGDNEQEAANDCLDQICTGMDLAIDSINALRDALKLDELSTETDRDDDTSDEWWYFFSIRFNTLADEINDDPNVENDQNKLAFDDCGTLYLKL